MQVLEEVVQGEELFASGGRRTCTNLVVSAQVKAAATAVYLLVVVERGWLVLLLLMVRLLLGEPTVRIEVCLSVGWSPQEA